MDYKQLLLKILEAINYDGDKEAFVTKFMDTTAVQAISDLIQLLPPENGEKVKQEIIAEGKDNVRVMQIVKSHFTDAQVQNRLEHASNNAIRDWIKEIDHTLHIGQRQRLKKLLEELK